MTTGASRSTLIAIGLGAIMLAGCASTTKGSHADHAPTSSGAAHGGMDMQAMCTKHRQVMASKPPAERQAMLEQHMKTMSMSPGEMRKHMQVMQERCK